METEMMHFCNPVQSRGINHSYPMYSHKQLFFKIENQINKQGQTLSGEYLCMQHKHTMLYKIMLGEHEVE